MVGLGVTALSVSGLMASLSAGQFHSHHYHHRRRTQLSSLAPQYLVPTEIKPEANVTSCGCVTYTTTWYGEPTLYSAPKPSTTSVEVKPTSEVAAPVPPTHAPVEEDRPKVAPKPKEDKPKEDQPPEDQPQEDQPDGEQPKEDQPQKDQPKEDQPQEDEPKEDQPKPAPIPANPQKPSDNSGHGGIAPNGNHWAMTYTPYRPDGQCKTAAEVFSDIGSIKSKGFTTVRIYGTDCNGPEHVGTACTGHGLHLILGIFIDGTGVSAAHEQISHLTRWGQREQRWSMIEMVVVGNEAIFGGFVTAPELARLVTAATQAFASAGYTGPVTTTEPLNIIQRHASTLCPVVGVVAANLHPFFNDQHVASQAGELVANQLRDLSAACDGKLEAYNLETGWPRKGKPNGKAVPGVEEQKVAIEQIVATVGGRSAIFSFEDDLWKTAGQFGVEQFWGCLRILQE